MSVTVGALAALFVLFGIAATPPGMALAEEAPSEEKSVAEADEKHEETIVVTASRAEEDLLSAPSAVTIVSGEELERSPAGNFADLLRRVPGMNVVQFSARDVNMVTRSPTGSLASTQLVAVDGRSIYQDFFGFVMWDALSIQPEEIDRIEAARGPGSAVWGANALDGVVNIRTRPPREIAGTDLLRLEVGELQTFNGAFLTARASDRVAWKVSGGWTQQGEPWPRPEEIEDTGQPLPPYEQEPFRNPRLDFRVDTEDVRGGTLSFAGGGATTSGTIHTGLGPFDIDNGTSVAHMQARWTRNRSEVLFFAAALNGEATNVLDGLEFDFKTLTTDLSYNSSTVAGGRHFLSWGGNVRRLGFDLSIAPGESLRMEGGAFLQDSWQIAKRWIWVLGSRVDWFDTIGTVVSPRIALIFRPDDRQALRLSWNRAYKAPSLVQNYLSVDSTETVELAPGFYYTFPFSARGNPELVEEKNSTTELGYTFLINDTVTLSASVFRSITSDLQDFAVVEFYSSEDPPPDWPLPPETVPPETLPKTFSYQNVGEVLRYGAELGLDAKVDPWNFYLSYSWQDWPQVTSGEDDFVVAIPPRTRASLGLNYDTGRWGATATLDYVGRAFWNDVLDQRFWGWTNDKLFVGGGFTLRSRNRGFEWSISGTNLLDDDDPQHVFGDRVGRMLRTGIRVTF